MGVSPYEANQKFPLYRNAWGEGQAPLSLRFTVNEEVTPPLARPVTLAIRNDAAGSWPAGAVPGQENICTYDGCRGWEPVVTEVTMAMALWHAWPMTSSTFVTVVAQQPRAPDNAELQSALGEMVTVKLLAPMLVMAKVDAKL